MISKLKIAEEEADEAAYWMETPIESGFMSKKPLNNLLKEADEITGMLVASIRTLRKGDDDKKQS